MTPLPCPDCGKPEVIVEMRATISARVYGIDDRHRSVSAFFPFDNAEWEIDDVYCEDCGWNGTREIIDYEWLGDYPPDDTKT